MSFDLLSRLLEYVERFADLNDEPADGGCRADLAEAQNLATRMGELEDALLAATCMVRDLCSGWAPRDLCQSPEEAMARLDQLIPGHEVMPLA